MSGSSIGPFPSTVTTDAGELVSVHGAGVLTRADQHDEARAAQVVEAATANRNAAEAWDALATQAATHAAECRHGAELAERPVAGICTTLPYTTERQTSWRGDKPYAARHSRHPRSMIERGIIENSLCAALRRLTQ